jgi:predicted DCC family thiol-disulfide oxidoreductase YuxK
VVTVVTTLTVLYDAECSTCQRAKAWLEGEVQLVPIEFVAAGSEEARRRFPTLDHARTLREVTAVADDGSVFRKDRAWIVILWSLARWRDVADHFANRWRRPIVRMVASLVDRRRRAVKRRRAWEVDRYGVAGAPGASDERAQRQSDDRCDDDRCGPFSQYQG